METESPDNRDWNKTYWIVFGLGIVFVLLLGLFTYLFNNPIL
jgi:hypothetical protein